jgi:hypothetical protein
MPLIQPKGKDLDEGAEQERVTASLPGRGGRRKTKADLVLKKFRSFLANGAGIVIISD